MPLDGSGKDAKDAKDGKLNIDAVEVRIDPRAEWKQILHEAWRINRDFFYDPNMHGVDLAGGPQEIRPVPSRPGDARRPGPASLRWMLSELEIEHGFLASRASGCTSGRRSRGGLLGADYEIANGRYRFKKVYGGLNWSPERARSADGADKA